MSNNLTREQWLIDATFKLSEVLFKPHGYTVPTIRVSVGFTGSRKGMRAIGAHWKPEATADQIGQIYISPVLADTAQVLTTLTHELVHATVGNQHGHGKVFRDCALKVGLKAPMTSTPPSDALLETFKQLSLPEYPHAKLNPSMFGKKQSTRMIKMKCTECGYIARTSRANLITYGPTLCPCNSEPMEY